MCRSFVDLSVDRQEQAWISAAAYAHRDGVDRRYWARAADQYGSYMAENVYPSMDRLTLEAHLLEVRDKVSRTPEYQGVVAAVEAELATRRPEPTEPAIQVPDVVLAAA